MSRPPGMTAPSSFRFWCPLCPCMAHQDKVVHGTESLALIFPHRKKQCASLPNLSRTTSVQLREDSAIDRRQDHHSGIARSPHRTTAPAHRAPAPTHRGRTTARPGRSVVAGRWPERDRAAINRPRSSPESLCRTEPDDRSRPTRRGRGARRGQGIDRIVLQRPGIGQQLPG